MWDKSLDETQLAELPTWWSHINRERIQLRNINIRRMERRISNGPSKLQACIWVLNAETAQVSIPKPGHTVYLPRIISCLTSSCSSYLLYFPWWHQPSLTAILPRASSVHHGLSTPEPHLPWQKICLAEDLTLSLHEALSKTLKKGWQKTPTEPKTMTHGFVSPWFGTVWTAKGVWEPYTKRSHPSPKGGPFVPNEKLQCKT